MRYFIVLIVLIATHSYFKSNERDLSEKNQKYFKTKNSKNKITKSQRDNSNNEKTTEELEDQEIIELEKELTLSKNYISAPLRDIANEPNFKEITAPKNGDFYAEKISSDNEVAQTSSKIISRLADCLATDSCGIDHRKEAKKDSRYNPNDTPENRKLNNALTALIISLDRDSDLNISDFISLKNSMKLFDIDNSQTRSLAIELVLESDDVQVSHISTILKKANNFSAEEKRDLYATISSSFIMGKPEAKKLISAHLENSIKTATPHGARVLTEKISFLDNTTFQKMAHLTCDRQKGSKAYQETKTNLNIQAEGRGIRLTECI